MEFECHNKMRCINKDYVCDGLPDCADNSDEVPAVCKFPCLNSSEFYSFF